MDGLKIRSKIINCEVIEGTSEKGPFKYEQFMVDDGKSTYLVKKYLRTGDLLTGLKRGQEVEVEIDSINNLKGFKLITTNSIQVIQGK